MSQSPRIQASGQACGMPLHQIGTGYQAAIPRITSRGGLFGQGGLLGLGSSGDLYFGFDVNVPGFSFQAPLGDDDKPVAGISFGLGWEASVNVTTTITDFIFC